MSYLEKFIDSHCHINSSELRQNSKEIIKRAYEAGVKKMVIVGCDLNDSSEAIDLAEEFSQYASIGIHPHEAKNYEKIPVEFKNFLNNDRVVAIGEIGLDYHYDNSPRDKQKEIFEIQLKFAEENNIPVILHIREAMNEAMEILRKYKNLKFLFHCYSGGFEYLDEIIEMNSLCSFGGAITWKGRSSDELREVLRKIPIENLLLETDCPYMAPIPFRGKLNEPSYVKYVYEKAAEIKNISVDELAEKISFNADLFFNWKVF